MTDYTDDQIAAEIRGCVDFYDRDRAIARHFLALGRQDKGEPVARCNTCGGAKIPASHLHTGTCFCTYAHPQPAAPTEEK